MKSSIDALRSSSVQIHSLLFGASFYGLLQPRYSRLLLFCAHDPVRHYFLVGGGLFDKELPCCFVALELFFKNIAK